MPVEAPAKKVATEAPPKWLEEWPTAPANPPPDEEQVERMKEVERWAKQASYG